MPVADENFHSAAVIDRCVRSSGTVLSIHVRAAGAQLLFKAKG